MGMRDINRLNYFEPIEHGDTVRLGGIVYRADNTMDGWRLSLDGTWKTEHSTIRKIPSQINFIAAIVREFESKE